MDITEHDLQPSLVWHNESVAGISYSIQLTPDASHVVVGNWNGGVYVLSEAGEILWKTSRDADERNFVRLVAGGQIVWACGADVFRWYGLDGVLQSDWALPFPARGRFFDITDDSRFIVAGFEGETLWFLDNWLQRKLWEYHTLASIQSVAIHVEMGRVVVASDRGIHVLDLSGTLVWENQIIGNARGMAVAKDGEYIVASNDSGIVFCVNTSGRSLWQYQARGYIHDVDIAADCNYVAIAGHDVRDNQGIVSFLDREGRLQWHFPIPDDGAGVAISEDGRYVAIGTINRGALLLENPSQLISNPAGSGLFAGTRAKVYVVR